MSSIASPQLLTIYIYDGRRFKGRGNLDSSKTVKELKQEYIDNVLCIDTMIGKATIDDLAFYNYGVAKNDTISCDNPQLLSDDSTFQDCGILNESVIVVKFLPISIQIGEIKKGSLVPSRFVKFENLNLMMTFGELAQMCVKMGVCNGSKVELVGNVGFPLNPAACLIDYGISNGSAIFAYEKDVEQKEEEANISISIQDGQKTAEMKDITLSMTVKELKQIYVDKQVGKGSVDAVKFTYSGKTLDDNCSLKDYEIENGSMVSCEIAQ